MSNPPVNLPLAGRVIVVIGGTTGLGLSGAKAIIAAGGRVVAVGLPGDAIDAAGQALGDDGRVMAGDATDPATAERAIDLALDPVRGFRGFDGLYHVAGGSGRGVGDGPLHEVADEAIDATLRLNLSSLILSNRAAVRRFIARGTGGGPGAILNMGSVLGSSPSPRYFATHVYAAAKSAVIGFTRSAAAYYADRDIRFNVIAPALVDTPMAKRAAGDDAIRDFIRTKQPLDGGRVGRPDDLDAAVVFLLSDQSRYVTGQVLAVDGGWSVSEGQYDATPAPEPTP